MKYWHLSSFAHAKEISGYVLWECKQATKKPKHQILYLLYNFIPDKAQRIHTVLTSHIHLHMHISQLLCDYTVHLQQYWVPFQLPFLNLTVATYLT